MDDCQPTDIDDIQLVNLNQASPILGITPRYYRELAAQKIVPPVVAGNIHFVGAIKALIKYYQSKSNNQVDKKNILLDIEIETKRHKLDVAKGKYLEKEKVDFIISELIIYIKNSITAMSTKLSPQLQLYETAKEKKALIDEYVNELLYRLSSPRIEDVARVEPHKNDIKKIKTKITTNNK